MNNYEKNLEFIRYYVENVLIDLKPMILSLSKERISINGPHTVKKHVKFMEKLIEINETKYVHLDNALKYNSDDIYEIFIQHTNISEYDEFCEILDIGWDEIYYWYCYKSSNKYFEFQYKMSRKAIDGCEVCHEEEETFEFYCKNCQEYYYFCDDCHENTKRCLGDCSNKVYGDRI
jgi:hypothetical protein